MVQEKTQLPYATIVAKLHQLCAEQDTGALMLRGGVGQTARIHVLDGNIVALLVQEKKGLEAIPFLAGLRVCQMDFIRNLRCSTVTPLPPTPELLAILTAQASASPLSHPPALTAGGDGSLDAATRTLLEETLTRYIGPMATVLCGNIFMTHQQAEDAIKALAATIPGPDRTRRFLHEIQEALAARL